MTSPVHDHPLATDAALRRRLMGLARHWLGDTGAAEDLLHDAYLRTTDGPLPASEASQEAWLVTVLRNLCIDQLRRQGRYQAILGQLAGEWTAESDGDQPEHLAAQAQRVDEALLSLIHHLPADDVAAWLLHEVFDVSHAELGALAGRSEVASRQRFHRLMARLPRPTSLAMPEDEDQAALFALCQQALVRCETAALVTLVRTAAPQAMAALATSGNRDPVVAAKAPRAEVVQVADQLALRIQVGDGPVTWIPLGEAMTEVA
ncbi:RNA polymerase sigma factor [Luteibacter sp. dw_328]|uniref:RNA polymerase sigma factor n=1 Tax=Luteibacter sp. dw_328 TaxID=2719796 RepID=UPI0031F32471